MILYHENNEIVEYPEARKAKFIKESKITVEAVDNEKECRYSISDYKVACYEEGMIL